MDFINRAEDEQSLWRQGLNEITSVALWCCVCLRLRGRKSSVAALHYPAALTLLYLMHVGCGPAGHRSSQSKQGNLWQWVLLKSSQQEQSPLFLGAWIATLRVSPHYCCLAAHPVSKQALSELTRCRQQTWCLSYTPLPSSAFSSRLTPNSEGVGRTGGTRRPEMKNSCGTDSSLGLKKAEGLRKQWDLYFIRVRSWNGLTKATKGRAEVGKGSS